jgi:hypothetical protein
VFNEYKIYFISLWPCKRSVCFDAIKNIILPATVSIAQSDIMYYAMRNKYTGAINNTGGTLCNTSYSRCGNRRIVSSRPM